MLKYFINTIFLLSCIVSFSQNDTQSNDTIIKNKYGLRVGIDLFNPANTFFNEDRKGLELVGDYRISKKLYVAAELGYLENISNEDFINFTTNGSYIKAGVDYNAYENWLNMENAIYVGFRYGYSTFSQTLNNFTVNNDPFLDDLATLKNGQKFDNLNAHWAEIVLGIKAEILNNLYLGFSFSGKKMITTKEPEGFKNLFVPGFNRVFLNNSGFGFNYTISYLIPLYKKDK
ncbi:MAG: DUF6048 family protein [Flavobacteriaceae bacterium]|nr:DUF6048 family protein [Flavobacteriaceae bacterium]